MTGFLPTRKKQNTKVYCKLIKSLLNFKHYQDVQSLPVNLQDQALPVATDERFKRGEVAEHRINGEYNYDFKFKVLFPNAENSISCYAI